jgi:UPF0755 protein
LRRWILVIVTVAVALCAAGLGAFSLWLRSELETPYYNAPASEIYLDIPRGANTTQIAYLLVSSGILHSRIPFTFYLRYKGTAHRIQAGEYRFSGPATPKEIAQRLIRGDVYYRSITVPEGFTARETIELLARNGLGNLSEMQQALLRTEWIRDLDPGAQNLEGYLFPETYRFGTKADSETVVKTMIGMFRLKIAEILKDDPLPPGWNVPRIVILASMIEKEVKVVEEGPLVASVLVNRLRKKIPLSCDATIIYAMKLAGTYRGNLSKADLKMESPYNTYIGLGLPPGPISNPGAQSLRAALRPAKTKYLYYVSRNDGTHQFSEDLASHNQAVDRFQRSPRHHKQ